MQSDSDDEEDDGQDMASSILADKLQDIHIDMDALDEDQLDCDEFFCVACNKTFKNQSSFRNHESSKKHKENVELIKLEMLKEEADLLSSDGESVSDDLDDLPEEEQELAEEEELRKSKTSTTGKKKKKQKGKQPNGIPVNSRLDSDPDAEDEESNEFLQQAADNSDDDWNAPSSSKTKKSKAKATVPGNYKKEKKNGKQESKEAKLKVEKHDVDTVDEKPSEVVDIDHKCVSCSEQFSSKNKLFMHLKKTNHGVYLPKGKVVTDNDLPALRKKGKRAK